MWHHLGQRPPPGAAATGGSGTGRPAWALPAQAGVTILAAVLYIWGLSSSVGMGNSFYAAAVKSGTESWKAFLFGSLDPGNFITVDKPPASLWVMELSGRIFGFSSWSMLLPEALAGVVTVAVLYHVVRRWFGDVAALLAALAMALTPIAVVMFRDNNPDALLTLLLVLSAWALWSALESGRTWPLVLCGALLGVAFTTKMLQAFIVVPVFGLVYLWAGQPRLGRRIVQLLWGGLALVVFSSWWVAIVELWPTASRPFIGSSSNNSELNLIFGYNGFGRLLGSGQRRLRRRSVRSGADLSAPAAKRAGFACSTTSSVDRSPGSCRSPSPVSWPGCGSPDAAPAGIWAGPASCCGAAGCS